MNLSNQELAQTELFRNVPDDILDRVRTHADPLELKAGDVLLSPERENHHIYVLLSGRLALHFASLDSLEILVLEKGASVGEISIIDQSMPSAFVLAKEDCLVFPVHRELLHDLVTATSPVARNLLRLLTQCIKAGNECRVKDRSIIGELTTHANIDALTGLYNRRWLDNAIGRNHRKDRDCPFRRYRITGGYHLYRAGCQS